MTNQEDEDSLQAESGTKPRNRAERRLGEAAERKAKKRFINAPNTEALAELMKETHEVIDMMHEFLLESRKDERLKQKDRYHLTLNQLAMLNAYLTKHTLLFMQMAPNPAIVNLQLRELAEKYETTFFEDYDVVPKSGLPEPSRIITP